MAIKTKEGNWIDGRGNEVPPRYIDKVDKERDRVVEKLVKIALKERERLEQLKKTVFTEFTKFIEYSAKTSGVKVGGMKGNIQLTNFSGNKRVEITIQDKLDFDERLQQAKELIDELLVEWSEGARDELKLIVNKAFNVDKKGRVNVKEILGLRKIKIPDKRWKKAMDLIDEARTVLSTKAYIRFQMREKNGEWKSILLDLASIDV